MKRAMLAILLALTCIFMTIVVSASDPNQDYLNQSVSVTETMMETSVLKKADEYVADMLQLVMETYTDLGYQFTDVKNMKVLGPCPVLNIDKDEITTLDYFLLTSERVLGVIHVYQYKGELHAEFGFDYAESIDEFIGNGLPFNVIHSNLGIYISSGETVKQVASLRDRSLVEIVNSEYNSDFAKIQSYNDMGVMSNYTINADDICNTIATFNSYIDDSIYVTTSNAKSAPPTPPLIPQIENGAQKWCHNAVTAMVAAAREQDSYSNLTAGDVYSTYNQGLISETYGRARKTCELIKNYLTSSDHYTTYSTSPITLTRFKNNIDDGHYVAAVSFLQDNESSYHVTLLYNYSVNTSSTTVRMVDPYNAYVDPISYRYCTWSGDTFTFSLYGNTSHTYEMSEVVISWY